MSSRKRSRAEPASQPAPAAAAAAASSSSAGPHSGSAPPGSASASASDAFASPTLLSAAAAASALFGVSAAVAVSEFRRFVTLKAFVSDTDATVLRPTPLMDHMWHAAILDTKLYRQMQTQIGLQLDHSPAGASMDPAATAARLKRLQTMRVMYRAKYGEEPREMSEDPVALADSPAGAKHPRASPSRSMFHIFIKNLKGGTDTIQVSSGTSVEALKAAYSEQLEDGKTMAAEGIEEGSKILMTIKLTGC